MSLHYGPEWCWDQSRPEAIEARRQMELFFETCGAFQRSVKAGDVRKELADFAELKVGEMRISGKDDQLSNAERDGLIVGDFGFTECSYYNIKC
jgi:hypothetical protein